MCWEHGGQNRSDLHGEVGDESCGGQIHLKSSFLGDGELVPHGTLDCGHSVAGRH